MNSTRQLSGKIFSRWAAVVIGMVMLFVTSFWMNYQVAPVKAATGDGTTQNIQMLDTDSNGLIDRFTFEIQNPNNETWQLQGASPYGLLVEYQAPTDTALTINSVSITSSATANPVVVQVDIDESGLATRSPFGDTDGTNTLELQYTQDTGDQTCTDCITDGVDEELNTIAEGDNDTSDTEQDAAAPVLYEVQYRDNDDDGAIDSIVTLFSENLDSASTLSANDLTFAAGADVGDFTGLAFTSDTDDLVTLNSSNSFTFAATNGTLTEATAVDTHDDSGNLLVTTQNGYSVTDGTNSDSTQGAQSQAQYVDEAAPVIKNFQYSDLDQNGKIDDMTVVFSETIDASESTMAPDDLTFVNVGDLTDVAFGAGSDATTSDQSIYSISLGTEASVIDTSDDSGNLLISTQNNFSVEDFNFNANSTLEAQTQADYLDNANPVIKSFEYQDNDSNGQIDQMLVTFSELLAGSSTLAPNDLAFDNVGDFTGAAFGSSTTNVIGGNTTSATVPLGTEATAVDTSDDSGNLAISAQNNVDLKEFGSGSSSSILGPQNHALIVDGAAPVVTDIDYSYDFDNDAPGSGVEYVIFNYSEVVGADGGTIDPTQFTYTENDLASPGEMVSGTATVRSLISGPAVVVTLSSPIDRTGVGSGGTEPTASYAKSAETNQRVIDTNGNEAAEFSGTTIDDVASPGVASISPIDGASGVSVVTDVQVTYTEPMDQASTESAFTLEDSAPSTIAGSFSWPSNDTQVFTPSSNLALPETFTTTVATSAQSTASTDPNLNLYNTYAAGVGSSFQASFDTDRSGSPPMPGSVSTTTTECSVTNPNGGETLEGGTSTDIVWDSQGTGIDNLNIHYSNDNGSSWTLITSGTDNDGLYSWSVPTSLNGSDALIKIECREAGGGVLDTDQSDATFSVAAAGQTDQDQGTGGTVSLPSGVSIGDLLKLPNDGDPTTYSDTAVYYIGLDGKRHPFPHAKVYKTWYADFSDVEVVSSDTMSAIQLGDPVLSRPGTHWVKIQSVPDTYYVEPGSYKLRHITDEQTAERLGGSDWNENVIDMPVTFFNNFDMGDPIEFSDLDNGWPEASLLKTPTDSAVWYIQNGERRQVEDMAAFNANGFQQRFIEENTQTGWQSLPTGDPIEGAEDGLFHEQLTP